MPTEYMKEHTFRVHVYCAANDLAAWVEVISPTETTAANFVKRRFFTGKGWEVTKVEKKHGDQTSPFPTPALESEEKGLFRDKIIPAKPVD